MHISFRNFSSILRFRGKCFRPPCEGINAKEDANAITYKNEILQMFLAICCNGSLNLFQLFWKRQLEKCLHYEWKTIHHINIISVFNNFEILKELI